ncbi:MAG: hypothetical protein P1V34_05040 [Alphaproteobacteria bacterium]|nr:hypothetical protein [Alphaproteobacteria bacterium]
MFMRKFAAIALMALFLPASALAMGFGNSSSESDVTYENGNKLAMDGKYSEAFEVLKKVVADDAKNADAWNMLGFSYRNAGDSGNAWDAYEHALTIDPSHKGAHEYLGEWYLTQGDMPSAKAQLEKLKMLCPAGCTESETLEASIKKAASNS